MPSLDDIDIPLPDPKTQQLISESCVTKSLLSGAMGMALGAVFALFTSGMAGAGMDIDYNDKLTTGQKVKEHFKDMGRQVKSTGKSFGMVGALYSGIECSIEKTRGVHDVQNAVYAGCAAGAILGRNGGPRSMATGCAGFAVFSYAIEMYMDH